MGCTPFLPSVPPSPLGHARRTGPGTSFGHEEKEETRARQRDLGLLSPLVNPPYEGSAIVFTHLSLIAEEANTQTKRPATVFLLMGY